MNDLISHAQQLMQPGLIDMHFDLPMDLYEKRGRTSILATDYWNDIARGRIGVIGVALYVEDKYMPEQALRVALGQIARLRDEVAADNRFALCRSAAEIAAARDAGQVALVITMEGVEPIGSDLDMLRIFHDLGVRSIGLTHARRNMAADGGVFAPSGSSKQGLTGFGREVIAQCEALGVLIDLAHLNPAGIDDVLAMTRKPLIVSHTNARKYCDIERNITDAHARAVAQRGGVLGMNAVLVSRAKADTTLDRYLDHIEHFVALCGIDAVGIGFDFFEFIYDHLPEADKRMLDRLGGVHFIPDLTHHGHAENVVVALIQRGFDDTSIEKILYKNWLRLLNAL